MRELYNALLAGLPRSGCVTRTVPGRRWTLAETDLGGAGYAMSTEAVSYTHLPFPSSTAGPAVSRGLRAAGPPAKGGPPARVPPLTPSCAL